LLPTPTAQLGGREGPQSHLQAAVFSIGRYLITIAMGLIVVIVVVSLLRGTSVTTTLEFALVVTIASIPVALPAVLSVTLAVGARELARHEAVVSRLPAVEEMSGVDVLCSDKTGTITKNQLAIAEVAVIAEGSDRTGVLQEAAHTAEPDGSDPIDATILTALGSAPDGQEVLELEPFDADRKRAEARVKGARRTRVPGREGRRAGDPRPNRSKSRGTERVLAQTSEFAENGYRALAVARAEDGVWHPTGCSRSRTRRGTTRPRRCSGRTNSVWRSRC
jgi:H+-transporting ATPase